MQGRSTYILTFRGLGSNSQSRPEICAFVLPAPLEVRGVLSRRPHRLAVIPSFTAPTPRSPVPVPLTVPPSTFPSYLPSAAPSHQLPPSTSLALKASSSSPRGPSSSAPGSGTRAPGARRRTGPGASGPPGSGPPPASPPLPFPRPGAANPPAPARLRPWSVLRGTVPARAAAREKDVPAPPRSRPLRREGCLPYAPGGSGRPNYTAPAGSRALLESACSGIRGAGGVQGHAPSSPPPPRFRSSRTIAAQHSA